MDIESIRTVTNFNNIFIVNKSIFVIFVCTNLSLFCYRELNRVRINIIHVYIIYIYMYFFANSNMFFVKFISEIFEIMYCILIVKML